MKYLSTQLGALGVAYLLCAAGMLVALLVSRADRRAFFRLPVYAVMAMALGVILWNALRKYAIPEEWHFTHTNILYWGALAIYVVLGLLLGLMLGRITRKREEPPEPQQQDGGRHDNP
jgi:ribose/xylose/arabinose/galactoside ABC-type transport system permease subunit